MCSVLALVGVGARIKSLPQENRGLSLHPQECTRTETGTGGTGLCREDLLRWTEPNVQCEVCWREEVQTQCAN